MLKERKYELKKAQDPPVFDQELEDEIRDLQTEVAEYEEIVQLGATAASPAAHLLQVAATTTDNKDNDQDAVVELGW